MHEQHTGLNQVLGSLFWRRRSTGTHRYLKVLTDRGCRETGYYIWPHLNGKTFHACIEGRQDLGKFKNSLEAQTFCENHYLEHCEY